MVLGRQVNNSSGVKLHQVLVCRAPVFLPFKQIIEMAERGKVPANGYAESILPIDA